MWATQQEHVIRWTRSFLSTLLPEGWAFHCDELMEEPGYIDTPVQRLGRLVDQHCRATHIILHVSLHTTGMRVDEAVDPLAGAGRFTSSPMQPQSYLKGKLATLDLVDDYRQAHPPASLQQVLDAPWRADRCRRDLCAGTSRSLDNFRGQSACSKSLFALADLDH